MVLIGVCCFVFSVTGLPKNLTNKSKVRTNNLSLNCSTAIKMQSYFTLLFNFPLVSAGRDVNKHDLRYRLRCQPPPHWQRKQIYETAALAFTSLPLNYTSSFSIFIYAIGLAESTFDTLVKKDVGVHEAF